MTVLTGLDVLLTDKSEQQKIVGNIGYLCHQASVDNNLQIGVIGLRTIFKNRLKKIFGPQHGFVTDVQDNMVESHHFVHPHFKIPVYSLYSETRIPTDEMLEGIDTMIVDLQDVGTRVYTYISTLGLLMKKCSEKNIKVVVLDRPNPTGGEKIEGNVLENEFHSFVGHHNIPMRHSLTLAEMGLLTKKYYVPNCDYDYILMRGWNRKMYFKDTGLEWINPSPNLSTPESAIVYPGTVIFEGTNLSEGRGTTRALELIGHPSIEAFSFAQKANELAEREGLKGCYFRATCFLPMFQKFAGRSCGGVQIHCTDHNDFNAWETSLLLCHLFYRELGNEFCFHQKPYEYEFDRLAFDLINGSKKVRQWVLESGKISELRELETAKYPEYLEQRKSVLLY